MHDGQDRRRYPRYQLHGGLSLELRVEVSGEKPAVLLTRGIVADISLGGVRCDIDFTVPVGTRVDLRFPDVPADALHPRSMGGHVVRTVSPGGVPDQVAIAFASPLEQLDPERLRAYEPEASRPRRTARAERSSWANAPSASPDLASGSLA